MIRLVFIHRNTEGVTEGPSIGGPYQLPSSAHSVGDENGSMWQIEDLMVWEPLWEAECSDPPKRVSQHETVVSGELPSSYSHGPDATGLLLIWNSIEEKHILRLATPHPSLQKLPVIPITVHSL